jgi:hypothetical protein
MNPDEPLQLPDLRGCESLTALETNRLQPKLGFGLSPLHMNMRRLIPIR